MLFWCIQLAFIPNENVFTLIRKTEKSKLLLSEYNLLKSEHLLLMSEAVFLLDRFFNSLNMESKYQTKKKVCCLVLRTTNCLKLDLIISQPLKLNGN